MTFTCRPPVPNPSAGPGALGPEHASPRLGARPGRSGRWGLKLCILAGGSHAPPGADRDAPAPQALDTSRTISRTPPRPSMARSKTRRLPRPRAAIPRELAQIARIDRRLAMGHGTCGVQPDQGHNPER